MPHMAQVRRGHVMSEWINIKYIDTASKQLFCDTCGQFPKVVAAARSTDENAMRDCWLPGQHHILALRRRISRTLRRKFMLTRPLRYCGTALILLGLYFPTL